MGGGVAFLPDGSDQEIIDLFLPGGKRGEHEESYSEVLFTYQEQRRHRQE